MNTKHIKVNSKDLSDLDMVAEAVRCGELVAFPTETVYGLGANALDGEAVRSIFKAKGRPNDNPLIVHISDISMLEVLVAEIKPDVQKLISEFWPGPLTLVFHKAPYVPDETTAGLDTVAVRMPDHPVALELIKRSGVPIAAPSANRSGRPSPTLAEHVAEDLDGRIAFIIDGGACRVGVESTVLDVTSDPPLILRPGGVTFEMIKQVIGRVQIDKSFIENRMEEKPKSPGMKYVHYAPKGEVIVVSGREEDVIQWVRQNDQKDEKDGIHSVIIAASEHIPMYNSKRSMSYGSLANPEDIAANIFRVFRECDRIGAEKIYVESVPREGIGYAIMDRVEKAAGGRAVHI